MPTQSCLIIYIIYDAMITLQQIKIANIESGRFRPTEQSTQAILKAFERSGLEFMPGGVRKQLNIIEIIEGNDFETRIMDFVYDTLCRSGHKEVLISGVDYKRIQDEHRDSVNGHIKRLQDAGKQERLLIKSDNTAHDIMGPMEWHRQVADNLFSASTPSFIFSDYFAIDLVGRKQIILIQNAELAEEQRRRFDYIWQNASCPIEN